MKLKMNMQNGIVFVLVLIIIACVICYVIKSNELKEGFQSDTDDCSKKSTDGVWGNTECDNSGCGLEWDDENQKYNCRKKNVNTFRIKKIAKIQD